MRGTDQLWVQQKGQRLTQPWGEYVRRDGERRQKSNILSQDRVIHKLSTCHALSHLLKTTLRGRHYLYAADDVL